VNQGFVPQVLVEAWPFFTPVMRVSEKPEFVEPAAGAPRSGDFCVCLAQQVYSDMHE
jgi:hypothetical protein